MITFKKCPICENEKEQIEIELYLTSSDIYEISCKICGDYLITFIEKEALKHKNINDRVKLSSFFRERTIHNNNVKLVFGQKTDLFPGSYSHLLNLPFISYEDVIKSFPDHISERLDRTLLNLYKLSKYTGDEVFINDTDYPIFYPDSIDLKATKFIMKYLFYDNLVEGNNDLPGTLTVTAKGLARIYEIEKGININPPQAFTAMWFDPSMGYYWENGFEKAIKACDYFPRRIDSKEHNGKICDEIIVEIRKSKFVICDFTGHRGGVYFEAGYALGMGLPVIWTCQEEWFNKVVDKQIEAKTIDGQLISVIIQDERKVHFDIDHYNFIVWKDEVDLFEKLQNRIKATIV
ncbi:hypothetical protein [Paenibacillus sp. GP183]|uniref:hypothetical protein n=1 Tax=Paenibacillus sp. GP183 TaxID=1882751 RepID=UPI000894F0BC|nr:hypothetical protein [Paenibacillus sp. GP183]SED15147.1 hypothetical protein SAMN05443246_5921 [Paenibacillus sp. GP183]